MANIETLKLLCAGSTRYHAGLRSTPSSDLLSRVEVAGLLAGLSSREMALAYAKHAGDLASERKLWSYVYEWAVGVAMREEWKIMRGRPTVANMSYLAVFEIVRPNRCSKCSGRGVDKVRVCGCCNGSGIRPLSGRTIASAIGIDQSNYCRIWAMRYQSVLEYVRDIDSKVNAIVRMADRNEYGHDYCNI